MPLTLTIDAVSVEGDLVPGSLTIDADLGARASCSLELFSYDGSRQVDTGQVLEVRANAGELVFAGTIDRYSEEFRAMDRTTQAKWIEVEAVDWHQLADRRMVAADFAEGLFPGAIVETLRADYLAAEGVTAGTIEDGFFTLSRQVFNYQTVTEALDELAEQVGFLWKIDHTKQLHFLSRASETAVSFELNDASLPVRRLRVSKTREHYRNRQLVRAGKDVTDAAEVESFHGDGETRTYTVAFEVAEEPTITVDRGGGPVAETVGIRERDAEESFDWYWEKGTRQLSQDSSGTVLSSTDTLEVTYIGFIPIFVQADNQSEITGRAAIEGGSGLYESLEDDERIESAQLAIDRAKGFLRRYGRTPKRVEIETDEQGLSLAGLQVVELTREGLSGTFFIQSMRLADRGDDTLRCTYDLVEGDASVLWPDFFKALARQGYTFTVRENEVVIMLRESPEALAIADVGAGSAGDSLGSWTVEAASFLVVGVGRIGAHWDAEDGTRVFSGALIAEVYEP